MTNPLVQYFRRPALYLKLPSGGIGYSEDAIDFPENGEVPVYPMTAIDEITSRTPDALFNGNAVVEIIKSCIPNIKDPWQMPVNDLDPILVAIRTATTGDIMEIQTECPSCKEEASYDVNLSGVLATFGSGEYAKPLHVGELLVKFKPLRFKELNVVNMKQFEIQRVLVDLEKLDETSQERGIRASEMVLNINDIAIQIISDTIEYIKTPSSTVLDKNYIIEFLKNCDKNTFDLIRDTGVRLRQSSESKPLEMKCMHCGHEYKQPFTINITDFFA